MHQLYSTLRLAVLPHLNAYREKAFADVDVLTCPLTGDQVEKATSRVNHHPRTFHALAWEWMQGLGLAPEDVELDDFGIANEALKEDWADFYESNARFRVVSKRAQVKDDSPRVIVSSLKPLQVFLNPTNCSSIQTVDRNVVSFTASPGDRFYLDAGRSTLVKLTVGDSMTWTGGGVSVLGADEFETAKPATKPGKKKPSKSDVSVHTLVELTSSEPSFF